MGKHPTLKEGSLRDGPLPAGLLLDLDDTLVPGRASYDKAMHTVGIAPNDPIYLESRAAVKKQLPEGAPIARSRALYFKKYLELKQEYSLRRHLDLTQTYETEVIQLMKSDWERKDRERFFAFCLEKNVRICIVTNESLRFQTQKLLAFFKKPFPLGLVTSEELGVEKPDPKIFKAAMAYLQIQQDQVIGIGDSFESDILGFQSLGISCFQTLEYFQDRKQHSHTLARLEDILNI
jgi:HAD superfamily hydrolase (TIGR01549 family)